MKVRTIATTMLVLAACKGGEDKGKLLATERLGAIADEADHCDTADCLKKLNGRVEEVMALRRDAHVDDEETKAFANAESHIGARAKVLDRKTTTPTTTPTKPAARRLSRLELFDTMWDACLVGFASKTPSPAEQENVARRLARLGARAAKLGATLPVEPAGGGGGFSYAGGVVASLMEAMGDTYPDRDVALLDVAMHTCEIAMYYGPEDTRVAEWAHNLSDRADAAGLQSSYAPLMAKIAAHAPTDDLERTLFGFVGTVETSLGGSPSDQ